MLSVIGFSNVNLHCCILCTSLPPYSPWVWKTIYYHLCQSNVLYVWLVLLCLHFSIQERIIISKFPLISIQSILTKSLYTNCYSWCNLCWELREYSRFLFVERKSQASSPIRCIANPPPQKKKKIQESSITDWINGEHFSNILIMSGYHYHR